MPTSVVIVTRRPEQWLDRCVASVADQADEVIVVDNASEGPTCADVCARYGARHLRQGDNLGFAPGVNIGLAAATQEHVALLNDDAFADPGWIAGAEAVLQDPTVGAVVPKLLFAWRRGVLRLEDPVRFNGRTPMPFGRHVGSITVGGVEVLPAATVLGHNGQNQDGFWTTGATMVVFPLPFNSEEVEVDGRPVDLETTFPMVNNAGTCLHPGGWSGDIGFGSRDDGSFDQPIDRFAACGAAVVARRSTWDRVGGLAESFFAYYEDTDWSWRVQLAGLRVRYDPTTVVRHVHAQTGHEGSPWFTFFVARNRVLCLARNAPARVVARTLERPQPLPPGVAKSLGRQLPRAFAARRRLSRSWELSPEDVWARWAGVHVPQ